MSYYEELGLTASATAEEIRSAHRTLIRLLHPDQQTEAGLRLAADIQMRRINAMVDILLDASRRRDYDEKLCNPPRIPAIRVAIRARAYTFSILSLVGIVALAVVITVAAIWAIAGDFTPWRSENVQAAEGPRMVGVWRSSRPQYVQVNIYGRNDVIYGEFSSRDVAFTFVGPVGERSAELPWTATDGSRGGIELRLLTAGTMQVSWHVAEFGSQLGIAGGAAIVSKSAK